MNYHYIKAFYSFEDCLGLSLQLIVDISPFLVRRAPSYSLEALLIFLYDKNTLQLYTMGVTGSSVSRTE